MGADISPHQPHLMTKGNVIKLTPTWLRSKGERVGCFGSRELLERIKSQHLRGLASRHQWPVREWVWQARCYKRIKLPPFSRVFTLLFGKINVIIMWKNFFHIGQVVCHRLPLLIEYSIRKLIKKFFIFLLTNCQNYVIIIVFSKGKQNIFKVGNQNEKRRT